MIKRIIDASLEMFDDSEVYFTEKDDTNVIYGNGDLKAITSYRTSGAMMRIKKKGKLGIASATTLEQPKDLLDQAAGSAEHGEEVGYSFSRASEFPEVEAYSKQIADFSTEKAIEMCEQAKAEILDELPDISLGIGLEKKQERIQIATAGGTRGDHRGSEFSFTVSAPIKGAGTSVYRYRMELGPFDYPDETVRDFIVRYRWTENTKTPKTGRMPVIWTPQAIGMFALSLCTGMSGEELVKKTSPLADKLDKKIFAESIVLIDDPHSSRIGARPFDDEGIPTEKRTLVEKGVLKTFLLDLRTGAKLGARSSGNGFKKALFGGGYSMLPTPWPANLWMEPGKSSLEEMIASLDEGILLSGGMGFHSGNYSQGHIAVQAIGFMIEKGEVTGRLDGTMLSTNIYEDFLNVRVISSQIEPDMMGHFPYILVDSMQIVGK